MRHRSGVPIALAGSGLLLFTGLSPVLAQKGPGEPQPPVVLRLLVQDSLGRQSEAAALDLATLAEQMTDGALTIEVEFDGGADIATTVRKGDVALAMLPSRVWDAEGVTSLDVLEAPFLIDNDALALAVATSDIADRAMAGLEAVGVTGLAMWPEDLRHLFAMNASGADLTTVAGLADADVLVVAGQPGQDLITTLGGRLYERDVQTADFTGDPTTDAAAGTLEGMVTGLWGAGLPSSDVTVAGDLVLYSKYQMLVANTALLDQLTEQQRADLDAIVAAMQQAAMGRHFTEASLAADICTNGGRVVSIGATAVGAFEAAAKPVTDRLAADPVTGELMAAVAALDAATPVAPDAGVCEPGEAIAPDYPISDTTGTYGTLPPDGSYRATVTYDELVALGVDPDWADENAGTMTWTFTDGRVTSTTEALGDCTGTAASHGGDHVSLTTDRGQPCDLALSFVWHPTANGIAFVLVAPETPWTIDDFTAVQALLEREWVRIDGPMPSLAPPSTYIGDQPVPAGTYRMTVTTGELEAAGATHDFAGLNQGTWTWTFSADGWSALHDIRNEQCSGGMTVADGHVQLTDRLDGMCGMGYQLRWRPAGDGIEILLVGLTAGGETPQALASEGAFINRVWTRVDGPTTSPATAAFIGDRLPPDGTYRAEITAEDLAARGSGAAFATANAGTFSWNLAGGRGDLLVGASTAAYCTTTWALVDGAVRVTFDGGGECVAETVDLRWRAVADGLELQVVAITPENTNERPWWERTWAVVS